MAENRLQPQHAKLFGGGAAEFVWGVMDKTQLPPFTLPEIAFAGRSNVGKSSLINAILNQQIARVSRTPGRTQQLNFFNIAEQFILVDMPGYGYAKVSKDTRDVWDDLIPSYLKGRPNLRGVFMLIDSRHGLKDSDKELMKQLDIAGVHYRLVLTKCDEMKPKALLDSRETMEAGLKKHPAAFPVVMPVSSHEFTGLDDVRDAIAALIV